MINAKLIETSSLLLVIVQIILQGGVHGLVISQVLLLPILLTIFSLLLLIR